MLHRRRPWREELEIIDKTMKSVSGITDPNQMVEVYWDGVGELWPMEHYASLSRRGVEPPKYVVTRSSRFVEHFNPWTQREKLPVLSGGILGEVAYADKPLVISDLDKRLKRDDPGWFYLEGFRTLIALPQYEDGKGLNVGLSLLGPDEEFDESMLPMMHWQASLFGRGTQNLVLRNQLAGALAELDRELQAVGEIQRSLLPHELPRIDGFDLAAWYQTSARAGGDYYDFFPIGEKEWGVFIADVSGHGTPAAVLMAITHAIAHTRPGSPKPVAEVLAHLNSHLAKSYTPLGSFVTAFYATLDPVSGRLIYSSAGHNPPRLLRNGKILSLDEAGGLPLGVMGDQAYPEATAVFQPGDLLLLYTDGITEAMTPPDREGARQLFGEARLDDLLIRHSSDSAGECVARIREEVTKFRAGSAPTDDQTLVAIRRTK
ncbi:MAG: PP2C family protein-serine/threonine phosphatase [Phycisphaeraceae bacterium]|nr:PP2C family protein-serine/threonine phosphatase [Phycisphaeraceae bacterium]